MSNKNKAWLILPLFCIDKINGKYGITIGWLNRTITISLNLNYNGKI